MNDIEFLKTLNNPLLWDKDFINKYNFYITESFSRKKEFKDYIKSNSDKIYNMWGFKVPTYTTVSRYNKFMLDIRILDELKDRMKVNNYRDLVLEINRYNLNPTTKIDDIQNYINKLSLDFVKTSIINKNLVINKINHYNTVLYYISEYKYNFTDKILSYIYDKPRFNSIAARTNSSIMYEIGLIFNDLILEYVEQYRKEQKI